VAGVADGEYYRLVTAAFLHGGLLHLALNMFALASLGPVLESALGRSRFLALYLLSALGGSTLSFLLAAPNTVGVGASGAIFGLFGAFYVVARSSAATPVDPDPAGDQPGDHLHRADHRLAGPLAGVTGRRWRGAGLRPRGHAAPRAGARPASRAGAAGRGGSVSRVACWPG
jgi:hypothetical protein